MCARDILRRAVLGILRADTKQLVIMKDPFCIDSRENQSECDAAIRTDSGPVRLRDGESLGAG